jgi:hypothetical protein
MPKQEVAEKQSMRSAFHVAAALFLPGTWLGRVFFCGIALAPWSIAMPPAIGRWVILLSGITMVFGMFAVVDSMSRNEMIIIGLALLGAWAVGDYLLGALATGGAAPLDPSGRNPNAMTAGGVFATIAIMWLLLGVPNRAHALGLDVGGKGSARRIIVKLLAAVSCTLSALIVMLLYFGDSPLRKPKLGLVLVGTLFMVLLLAPYYRKTADAVWRHGFPGVVTNIGYLREPWQSVSAELRKAVRSNDRVPSVAEDGPATLSPWEEALEPKSAEPDA